MVQKRLGVVAVLFLAACGDQSRVDDILALSGDATAGESVFSANCAACHGADGTGGSGPDLTSEGESDAELAEYVLFGEEEMPGFDGDLDDQEIADVVAYVSEVLQAGAESDGDD